MMVKILLSVVLFLAVACAQEHHASWNDIKPTIRQVPCNQKADRLYNDAIDASSCGEPRQVYLEIKPPTKLDKVTPRGVWVKRCAGICDFDAYGAAQCVPTSDTKSIHTRIFNIRTEKERCATYDVEEHTNCGCAAPTYDFSRRLYLYNASELVNEVES